MGHIRNLPEKFFREIRSIEIYDAKQAPYINVYKGIYPNPDNALFVFDLNPDLFSQKISTKTQSKNYFTDYDISFSLLDLAKETIEECERNFNKQNFTIVLISNVEKILFGNDTEKMKVEFIDNKKNDGSGNDECTINISGQSILRPKIQTL